VALPAGSPTPRFGPERAASLSPEWDLRYRPNAPLETLRQGRSRQPQWARLRQAYELLHKTMRVCRHDGSSNCLVEVAVDEGHSCRSKDTVNRAKSPDSESTQWQFGFAAQTPCRGGRPPHKCAQIAALRSFPTSRPAKIQNEKVALCLVKYRASKDKRGSYIEYSASVFQCLWTLRR
jgi:hypothetical protein